MAQCSAEMPRYRSHKTVWALKIKRLYDPSGPNQETDGGLMFEPEEPGYGDVRLDPEYVRKHQPKEGGYYVVYEDGYKSWSPAEAFVSGYSRE